MNNHLKFINIDWKNCYAVVFDLQSRIAVAYKAGENKKVTQLQHNLVRSFEARALAVRRVVTNSGGKTPGLDGILWKSDIQKFDAIKKLRDLSNYQATPVRRVFIPYTKRTIGIPIMYDRAVQALWMMALIPIAECTADTRSYGFRPYRSVLDVATYLKLVLGSLYAKRWVLEADIKGFFDNLSNSWLLENIPMDKRVLREFLKAGQFLDNKIDPTDYGVPQGGVISPIIANMALDGLENCIQKAVSDCILVRYADNFIIIGRSEQLLREHVWPAVVSFLKNRGLELKMEKTRIISINQGFEFLGFHFKEFEDKARAKGYKKGIFLVQPTKRNISAIMAKLKMIVENHRRRPIYPMIIKLNQVLRGWSDYFRSTTTTRTFSSIGAYLFRKIWITLKSRHRGVPLRVLKSKYFISIKGNNWVLRANDGKGNFITLFQIGWVTKQRHICCQPLNPFLPENQKYFEKRIALGAKTSVLLAENRKKLASLQKGLCALCGDPLLNGEPLEIHHVIGRKTKNWDAVRNLKLLHKLCHERVTYDKDPASYALFKQLLLIPE